MDISTDTIMLLIFVFIIAAYLGVELISKVPSQLHTPLMSGTNAISGITIVGAIAACAINTSGNHIVGIVLGAVAIFFATVNVIGGYFVTDRMLAMFKKKEAPKK
ncbi:MAG: NAD(P) transhydrogenase subunit alpha [Saccharofermentans sp.]|nr:NAD(P) transhydrogenase subunit alpha [Saccharofermentans sp.]